MRNLGSAIRERKASPCQTLVDLTVTSLFILTYILEGIQHPLDPAGPYIFLLRHASSLPVQFLARPACDSKHFNDCYTGNVANTLE
jgi:hypothetical protein